MWTVVDSGIHSTMQDLSIHFLIGVVSFDLVVNTF